MDVRHLPLEHPATYKEIREIVINAVLPGLEAVAGPALKCLQPALLPSGADKVARERAKHERTLALSRQLLASQVQLLDQVLTGLQPSQLTLAEQPPRPESKRFHRLADNDDAAETRWDLVLWLLDGLYARDFPNKTVMPAQRGGAPFYLYRLAQQLADKTEWRTPDVANNLQNVLFELSAEHTRERLQVHYGVGGGDSINHITKVLRPVDSHQNEALKLLGNRVSLPEPASLVVGEPYHQQEFAIRLSLRRWHIPVRWLMSWTECLQQIRQALRGHPASACLVSDEMLGSALSSCKDVYLKTPEATERKLTEVLQQLADLHELGGKTAVHVDLADLLERLEGDSEEESGDAGAASRQGPAQEAAVAAGGALAGVFSVLDHVAQPFVRVGVMLLLLKGIPIKKERGQLAKALVDDWAQPKPQFDGMGLFERLGAKPGIASLTDAALAKAADMTLAVFKAQVQEARASLAAALAGNRSGITQD